MSILYTRKQIHAINEAWESVIYLADCETHAKYNLLSGLAIERKQRDSIHAGKAVMMLNPPLYTRYLIVYAPGCVTAAIVGAERRQKRINAGSRWSQFNANYDRMIRLINVANIAQQTAVTTALDKVVGS